MNYIIYICVYVPVCVCVCVYGLKNNNKMDICVFATHFPDYIQAEIAILLSFVLLVHFL